MIPRLREDGSTQVTGLVECGVQPFFYVTTAVAQDVIEALKRADTSDSATVRTA